MSRIARVVVEGVPYHVTQRGNARQTVFLRESDFRVYRERLQENAKLYDLSILAYCLMPNHIHLVCIPAKETSLARALGRTAADYARFFNVQNRSCGHVWQARYYSCPLDLAHLWNAMAYVERNPVRAGLSDHAEKYRWSSARAHTEPGASDSLLRWKPWIEEYDPNRWLQVLRSTVEEEAMAERIRDASRRGRPLGSKEFVAMLEQKTGRRLAALPLGRPRHHSLEKGA